MQTGLNKKLDARFGLVILRFLEVPMVTAEIKTLPALAPDQVWCFEPYWKTWSAAIREELRAEAPQRARRKQPPLVEGTPPAGAIVWLGTEYARYQPETP